MQKKRQINKIKVDVDQESIWDKMKKTPVTISVAEYLASNKKAAQEVKQGIMYLHRRKRPTTSTDPVVINNLRSARLLDEDAFEDAVQGSISKISTSDDSSEYSYGSDNDTLSTTNATDATIESVSDNNYYSDEFTDTDDEDTVIEYPYVPDSMRTARPSRVLVAINDKLVEAVLDSGASVSVMSLKLANRLGIIANNNELVPLVGFANNGKTVHCKVATDVKVRIGG
ncbi:MAG: hypothetical protein EXX96DRAFT_484419, partial [Benjaminiella poitrasii]